MEKRNIRKRINQREKQPEVLRSLLLKTAGEIILQRGVPGLTLDAVAAGAGVSKGGLLHHFSNKPALIEAVFCNVLEKCEEEIRSFAQKDPDPRGRFTRAYLKMVSRIDERIEGRLVGLFTLEMHTVKHLRKRWNDWIEKQEKTYGESPPSLSCCIVRAAADGLWLSTLTQSVSFPQPLREQVVSELEKISRE